MSLLGYTTKFHYDMETPKTEDSQCKLTKTSVHKICCCVITKQ